MDDGDLWDISRLKCFQYHIAIDFTSHSLARTEHEQFVVI